MRLEALRTARCLEFNMLAGLLRLGICGLVSLPSGGSGSGSRDRRALVLSATNPAVRCELCEGRNERHVRSAHRARKYARPRLRGLFLPLPCNLEKSQQFGALPFACTHAAQYRMFLRSRFLSRRLTFFSSGRTMICG